MTVFVIDPIRDPRWPEFLERHPKASMFHTPGWLNTLRLSYGYEPVVLTTSPPRSELNNGVALCYVNSWLTGRRLVSLPFSDHCDPLIDTGADAECLADDLRYRLHKEHCDYIELRPTAPILDADLNFGTSATFFLHRTDLRRPLDYLYRTFHASCIRGKVRRALREGLVCQVGNPEDKLHSFYKLFVSTARRHHSPPHTMTWLRNLIRFCRPNVQVDLALKDRCPIAGILTVRYKQEMVYKYGCSDPKFHKLGGTVFLLWKAIQEAKTSGITRFDWGRSDPDYSGLVTFKDHWGAQRSTITYLRYPSQACNRTVAADWKIQVAKHTFGRMPNSCLIAAARLLCRHAG